MKNVIVIKAPISEKYWHKGCLGTVRDNQIRVGGCWFDFDERWKIKEA